MSRLSEALKRANGGASSSPVDTSASFDTFPVEGEAAEPLRAVVDDEPRLADEQTLTLRSDSTGRRVQADPNGGGRVQTDSSGWRVCEQRGPAKAPEAPLALFTEFNKKLVERLVVPNGAP